MKTNDDRNNRFNNKYYKIKIKIIKNKIKYDINIV